MVLVAVDARGDGIGYGGTRAITVTNGTLTFDHAHNWDSTKVETLFFDLTHHERFFSPENDFAFVELRDGEKVLFCSPSPALSHLWISPDGQFFVGLSDIMLRNPYQLVVWRRDGTVIHHEHISAEVAKVSAADQHEFATGFPDAERFLSGRYFNYRGATYLDYEILGMPNHIGHEAFKFLLSLRTPHPYSGDFSQTVTNFVYWFDRYNPDISITRTGGELALSLRSPSGKPMTIPIRSSSGL